MLVEADVNIQITSRSLVFLVRRIRYENKTTMKEDSSGDGELE